MIARRRERLTDLERELTSRAGVQVRAIAADVSLVADNDALLTEATRGTAPS